MLDNFIDSLDNSSDIKFLAMSIQIVMLNNDTPNPGNNASSLKKNKDFLGDKLQA